MDSPLHAVILTTEEPLAREHAAAAEENGWTVGIESDPNAVLARCRRDPPQAVVVDWSLLPGAGDDWCRQLRAGGEGLPVLIAVVEPGKLAAAAEAGVDLPVMRGERTGFGPWLQIAARRARELAQTSSTQVARVQQELEATTEQLEAAIARANQLAMEAERAYIELNQIFFAAPGGILLIDRESRILRCNETFVRMAGFKGKEPVGRTCRQVLSSPRCGTPACPLVRIAGGEERVQDEMAMDLAEGEAHFLVTGAPFRAPDGELIGTVLYLSDITDRVRAEQALKESEQRYMALSIIDELTGLYNKRSFWEQLAKEMARTRRYGHPLSLVMLDIDDFKYHNDTYGHAEGDKVLARLGELLRGCLRTTDVPCRYGGEEFVVILPVTTGEQALIVAERIRTRFGAAEFEPAPGERIHKTISLGVAQCGPDEEGKQLLARTDRYLYQAKEQGKNRTVLGKETG